MALNHSARSVQRVIMSGSKQGKIEAGRKNVNRALINVRNRKVVNKFVLPKEKISFKDEESKSLDQELIIPVEEEELACIKVDSITKLVELLDCLEDLELVIKHKEVFKVVVGYYETVKGKQDIKPIEKETGVKQRQFGNYKNYEIDGDIHQVTRDVSAHRDWPYLCGPSNTFAGIFEELERCDSNEDPSIDEDENYEVINMKQKDAMMSQTVAVIDQEVNAKVVVANSVDYSKAEKEKESAQNVHKLDQKVAGAAVQNTKAVEANLSYAGTLKDDLNTTGAAQEDVDEILSEDDDLVIILDKDLK
ncbi:hypothetical protein E3N88_17173 [Mikania micrantha]|uniref:Uncharacterized protein n=1 Tax=Mikania micrantha TaxID=192012 RepID=A0A5N6NU38_9ASTR|nr:hypothetical protein E3N88_17173 [Mikania micrantha]